MLNNTENAPTAATEVSLATIEQAAKRYADRRSELGDIVRLLNYQVDLIKRAALADIKRAVARTADTHSALRSLLETTPGLFVKPRTVIFHGIKCGWEKGKGKVVFEDSDKVCQLINKHFPELAEHLVIIKETPNKKALAELPASDLKRLGITIEDTGDAVVIRAVDTTVDKIVNALLAEAEVQNN